MNARLPAATGARRGRAPGLCQRLMRARVLARLSAIRDGSLTLRDGDREHRFGSGEPAARVDVHDGRFWTASALGGSLGAGASYIDGCWDCDDLTAMVRVLCRNRTALEGLDGGMGASVQPAMRLVHALQRNSLAGAARNVRAHYDLGNDLFERMLDPDLIYSAALYDREDASLDEAQRRKCERVCELLELGPQDRLIEIGGGWGGFAVHAARRGCRVTTTTISPAQRALARQRIAGSGLDGRIELLGQDWRALRGAYSRLASIEMIEAIGWRAYPAFFRCCAELLDDDGLALIQCITIPDHRFAAAAREVDFIKRFVFPGSCIPSVAVLRQAAAASGLRLVHLEDHAAHYARTIAGWRANLRRNAETLRRLGYGGRFERMWDFYLAYSEGAFAESAIGSARLLFAKPRWRPRRDACAGGSA